jgi:acyl carrier protein
MDSTAIGTDVCRFIGKNFLFDEKAVVNETDSLLGTGVVDSTGILELICYLEERYKLKFQDNELVADNFDSIQKISSFISGKLS